ncbi:hypothetical protein IJJ18_01590 [Candidatus Saccharibacteria bacterium]|nr:hypothetical protein [Candidatus Saccharibacteria bacterium]
MNVSEYAKGVEKMVNPMMVGQSHYMQTKLRKLPVFLQRKIIKSATKKADKMPFVVEPYCTFMFYELEKPDEIAEYLPQDFVPTKASVFAGDTPKYYGVVSMFRIHTSVFWGSRAEFYLMAENAKTGLLSWVMMDYISDTISYDEQHGLKSPDVTGAIMTTTCEGDFVCEMNDNDKKTVCCEANLEGAKMRALDERFWIEGNTSIAYGRLAGEPDGDLFSLTFFPEEMSRALDIPISKVRVAKASTGLNFTTKLDRVISFPYAQHMLSDSPGASTHYGSKATLRKAVESVDFKKINGLAAGKRK